GGGDRGAGGGRDHPDSAGGQLLAVLLHRVVLSACRDRPVRLVPVARARGGAQRTPGAGSSTCSIAIARLGSAALISTASSQGSSLEVSNLTGIRVTIASSACSRLTPITPPRG